MSTPARASPRLFPPHNEAVHPTIKRERGDDDQKAPKSKKPISHEYDSLITALVGPDEVAFTVQEHFICAKSKVFRTACSERGTVFFGVRVVRLADAEPRTFKNYLKWVYTNEIVVEVEDVPDKTLRRPYEQEGLIKLYVLGNTLDDVRLRNQILRDLININYRPFTRSVDLAYGKTTSPSNLREVLVQLAVYRWNRDAFLLRDPDYNHELLRDLVSYFMLTTRNNMMQHPIKLLPANLEDEANA